MRRLLFKLDNVLVIMIPDTNNSTNGQITSNDGAAIKGIKGDDVLAVLAEGLHLQTKCILIQWVSPHWQCSSLTQSSGVLDWRTTRIGRPFQVDGLRSHSGSRCIGLHLNNVVGLLSFWWSPWAMLNRLLTNPCLHLVGREMSAFRYDFIGINLVADDYE